MKSKKGHKGKSETAVKVPDLINQTLLTDIRNLILSSLRQVAQAVNSKLAMLYREIGRLIRQDIFEEKWAAYGKEIVAALRRQLGWTHFKSLIPAEDSLKRGFYAEMCRVEGWSTRTPDKNIQSMLYEHMALLWKPEKLSVIQRRFERLYDPRHPVRNHIETLDSVKVVKTIREALKR